MKSSYEKLLKIVLGISILAILFYKVGFREVYQTFLSINLLYIPFILIIWLFLFLIGTFNIRLLLKGIKREVPFSRLFRHYLTSWSLGLLTPGKLGEFSLIYFLKKEDIPVEEGATISIIDKLVTLFSLILLTIIGLFILFGKDGGLRAIMILVLILIITIFFVFNQKARSIIKKYVLEKYFTKFGKFTETFFKYLKEEKKLILENFIITLIKWVVSAIATYLIFLSFNFRGINFIYIILIDAVAAIVSLVPFTINGIGLKESTGVLLFKKIGIAEKITANVYIFGTVLTYITAAFIFFTLRIKKNRSEERVNKSN